MSDIIPFGEVAKADLPAYFNTEDLGSNLNQGASIPSLSIRGKVFRIQKDGEELPLTRHDPELGDNVPVQVISTVVLEQGPFGARIYYRGQYDPEKASGPVCFSLDGQRPDAAAPEPQASTCAACPHAVKGSKMTMSGLPTTACTLQRRLAVVMAAKLDGPALLLRLAPTSAFDKETKNAQNGWFAWKQYCDFLASRGVRHTAQVVTMIRFDPNSESPKLLFKPERFLTKEEWEIVKPRITSDEVKRLLFPSQARPEPQLHSQPEPQLHSQPEPQLHSQPEPQPEAQAEQLELPFESGGATIQKRTVGKQKAPQPTDQVAKVLEAWADD